jgi:gamma-glutamylcyclotransferase (GGCT)/AIG2-like uncharacterized protein YtfP
MEYLFVYGQFRDSGRSHLGNIVKCGKASVSGRIYRVNEFYPGLVEGDGLVWGDVYLIDPKVLPNLDEFEGDEYYRKKIKTHTDLECWVYIYKYNISKFSEIQSGDWLLR